MDDVDSQAERPARKPRADAQRNRERLLEAAKAAFADVGPDVSLDEIARRAGVGIGTLYRHFPNRDAIVEAVYRREVQQLADAATRLLATCARRARPCTNGCGCSSTISPPRRSIASALSAIVGGASELYAASGARITDAMSLLVDARRRPAATSAPTSIRSDLLRALVGFTYGNASPGWQASALRLIDILMDGLRPER